MANLTSSLKISLIDDVSKPAKTVANALKEAERNAKNVANAMKGAGATDRFVGNLSKLKLAGKDIEQVSKAWRDYAKSAGLAANAANWTKAQAAGVKAWEQRTIASLRAVKREQQAFRRAQAAAMGPGGLVGVGVGAAAGGRWRGRRHDALSAAAMYGLPGAAGSLVGMGGAYAVGGAVGLGVAGGVGTAGVALKQAVDFQSAMADVKKKVNLDKGASWADVEEMINKNARAVGLSRVEMARLASSAGQAGIEFKDLGGFMNVTAKAASAWDMSADEAANKLAHIKAQTQWTIPQLEEYADKVNKLGDTSAAAERDIVEMFNRSAGAAKAAGVSFDTSLAATTALASIGMQEEVASRFFNAFTSKLRTATSLGKDAAAGFKMLGMSVQSVEKGMKKDSTKTIFDVLDRLEKHPDKASIATKIFGQQWWDEASRFGQAIPEMRKNLELLGDPSRWKGSLQQNLNIDLATTEKHFERLKALASEVGDSMMRWALPDINSGIGKAIDWWEGRKQAEKRRDEVKPTGESVSAFERRLGLDRVGAPAAMFTQPRPQGGRFGVVGGISGPIREWATPGGVHPGTGAPAFARMEGAEPHINTGSIDSAKASVDGLKQSFQGLGITVTPIVNPSSMSAALSIGERLLSVLREIGGAAASAGSSVDALSSKIGATSAKLGTLRAQQNSQFGASGQKGE